MALREQGAQSCWFNWLVEDLNPIGIGLPAHAQAAIGRD
jgi:hypothetical protein